MVEYGGVRVVVHRAEEIDSSRDKEVEQVFAELANRVKQVAKEILSPLGFEVEVVDS